MKNLLLLCMLCLLLFKTSLAQTNTQKLTPVFSTLIFPPQQNHTHGSSIVSLPNGDFLCTWFMGSGERTADDVKIMGARLQKGSNTWSTLFYWQILTIFLTATRYFSSIKKENFFWFGLP